MAMDAGAVQRIREDFPALRNYGWFQNGGVSITPLPVHEEHARLMREILERGPMHIVYPDEEYPRRRQSIARLARFFGVDPGEIALMRGVSEAFQTVLRGRQWEAGDRIVISANEEASVHLPVLYLRDRFGVEVVELPLLEDESAQVEAAAGLLTERTRLVALSHVTTDFGYRLPVAPICDLARRRGIATFLDLAHSAGLSPISLRDLGCDYAGVLSYKWMYAPYAAGLLFIRRECVESLPVTYPGGRSERWLDFESGQFALRETAERFQFGPWSWPLVHAWARAADYLDEVGLEAIWERTALLARRLKSGLHAIPGCTVWTPAAPERSAALVTFAVRGTDGAGLASALRARWQIIAKRTVRSGMDGLRTSVPFFLLEEEIDRLLEAIRTLAGEVA
jgi:selenocysteine lyase/cysteine desulfurase